MIDVWAVCWRAPVEKKNYKAMITLYQLKTNANRWLTNMAASDALPREIKFFWDNFLKELGNQAQLSSQAYWICAQAFLYWRDLFGH